MKAASSTTSVTPRAPLVSVVQPVGGLANRHRTLFGLLLGEHALGGLANAFGAQAHLVEHAADVSGILGQRRHELIGLVVGDIKNSVQRAAHQQDGKHRTHGAGQAKPLAEFDDGSQHERDQDRDQDEYEDGLGNVHQGEQASGGQHRQGTALDARMAPPLGVGERAGAVPRPRVKNRRVQVSGAGGFVLEAVRCLLHLLILPAIAAWLAVNPCCSNYTCVVTHHEQEKPPGRTLALDVGSRTIGLAVTDPLGFTAQGLLTIRRKNKRTDLAALAEVIANYGVVELVVGLPLRMSGAEGRQSEKMREFVEVLQKHFALPIHLWDERLTSVEANRVLRETEMSIKKRAAVVDQLAAVLILQNWMEARHHPLDHPLDPR